MVGSFIGTQGLISKILDGCCAEGAMDILGAIKCYTNRFFGYGNAVVTVVWLEEFAQH